MWQNCISRHVLEHSLTHRYEHHVPISAARQIFKCAVLEFLSALQQHLRKNQDPNERNSVRTGSVRLTD